MVFSLGDFVYIRDGIHDGRTGVIRVIVDSVNPYYRLVIDPESAGLINVPMGDVTEYPQRITLRQNVMTNMMVDEHWMFGGRTSTQVIVERLARAIVQCDVVTREEWIDILNTRIWEMNCE
jgi:hypothetical protein